jgi:hypothetical protein
LGDKNLIMKRKSNDEQILNDFIDFINTQSGNSRHGAGYGQGRPSHPNEKLLEISSIALVVGFKPDVICSLIGYDLTVYRKTKKLSLREMDDLFSFVQEKIDSGSLKYIPTGFDLTIMDGNSYSYFISWNGVKSHGSEGHTMPNGLNNLLDYCERIIK